MRLLMLGTDKYKSYRIRYLREIRYDLYLSVQPNRLSCYGVMQ
jgi:hypothetical protein